MRVTLFKEEDNTPGNFLIPRGGITWVDGLKYPLVIYPEFLPIGHILDIRREDDDTITAELVIMYERVEDLLPDASYSIYCRPVVRDSDSRILSAGLRDVSLIPFGSLMPLGLPTSSLDKDNYE